MSLPSTPSAPSATKRSLRPDDGRLLRGRRARARIHEAARELFREKGFDRATLREIATRAGMGVSSLYRHIQSKEELLIVELVELQEQAWLRFRREEDRALSARARVRRWVEVQHELLNREADFSRIALRATTHPEARVAGQVLALHDRSMGLIAEILMKGRMRRDLARDLDVMAAAQAIFYITNGARIPWANGLLSDEECLDNTLTAVELLFQGLEVPREPEVGG